MKGCTMQNKNNFDKQERALYAMFVSPMSAMEVKEPDTTELFFCQSPYTDFDK